MGEKLLVMLSGPGHEMVNHQMMPAFLQDKRLTLVGQPPTWDMLAAQLPVYKPEVLVVHAGLAPGPDALLQLLGSMQAWNGVAIVLLPGGAAKDRGAFENMPGVVAGVYDLPVNWAELPAQAFSAGETARARKSKVSAAPMLAGAPAGNGHLPPGLQPVLTGTKRIAVLSHAGGAGVSTIAESMAYELAVRLSIRSLLFSLGMPPAAPAHMPLRYIPNLVEFFERPTRASIQSAIQRIEGLEVLVAPENSIEYLRAAQVVDTQAPNSIYAALMAADDGKSAAIIMDLPGAETPWLLHPLYFANVVLIVARPTTADLFAVRHTLNALSLLGSKLPRESIHLVLNQHSETSALTPRQFMDELANANDWAPSIVAVIEHDPNVLSAQNQRVPVVTRSEKMARGVRQIIANLFPGTENALAQSDGNNGNSQSFFRLPKIRFG